MNIVEEYIAYTFDPEVEVVDEPLFLNGKKLIFPDGEIIVYSRFGADNHVIADMYEDGEKILSEEIRKVGSYFISLG